MPDADFVGKAYYTIIIGDELQTVSMPWPRAYRDKTTSKPPTEKSEPKVSISLDEADWSHPISECPRRGASSASLATSEQTPSTASDAQSCRMANIEKAFAEMQKQNKD